MNLNSIKWILKELKLQIMINRWGDISDKAQL